MSYTLFPYTTLFRSTRAASELIVSYRTARLEEARHSRRVRDGGSNGGSPVTQGRRDSWTSFVNGQRLAGASGSVVVHITGIDGVETVRSGWCRCVSGRVRHNTVSHGDC